MTSPAHNELIGLKNHLLATLTFIEHVKHETIRGWAQKCYVVFMMTKYMQNT